MISSLERKIKVWSCILMFLLSNIFIFIPNKLDIIDNNTPISKNIETTFLKDSNFYNLTGSSIFIDDSDPNYNWSKTAAENNWCRGSGTWNDPFIIENVTIDAQNPFNIETVILDYENSTACITIQNSNVNFIIRNCTILNSGARILDCGIKLINVNNSQLVNNNLSSNSYGIYLPSMSNSTYLPPSSNNTILYNIIKNGAVGILLYNSYSSKFLNNTIRNNLCGIVETGYDDKITLNVLDKNGCGILCYGTKNKISKNNLTHNIEGLWLLNSFNNKGNGIFLQSSWYNNISKNECSSNKINGIQLQGRYDPFFGPFQDCNYNWILENVLYNNSNGILLNYTKDNIVNNNIINFNQLSGVELNYSDYIDILNNTIDGNYCGINMKESDWNDIIQNTINNNYYGVSLSSSHRNHINGNTLHYNRICYIENDYCVGNNYEDNDCIEIKINEINWFIIFGIFSLIGLVILLFVLLEQKRPVIDSDN